MLLHALFHIHAPERQCHGVRFVGSNCPKILALQAERLLLNRTRPGIDRQDRPGPHRSSRTGKAKAISMRDRVCKAGKVA